MMGRGLRNRLSLCGQCFLFALLLLIPAACDNSNPLTGDFPSESAVEARSFDLINQERAKVGLPAVSLDPQIAAVARTHSQDMRDRGYFAHNDPDGKSPSNRLKGAGVTFQISGENIARTTGMKDPAVAANSEFLAHKEHRDVLFNPQFTRAGVGVARSGSDYWITQNFIGD